MREGTRRNMIQAHEKTMILARSIVENGEHHSLLIGLTMTDDNLYFKVALVEPLPMTGSVEGKKLAASIINKCAETLGMAIHVCEGWAIKRPVDDIGDERPSEAADRQETLIVTVVHGTEARAFAIHSIVTKDGKRCVEDAELQFDGEDGFEMLGILGGKVTQQ